MNMQRLTIHMMITFSAWWLGTPSFVAALKSVGAVGIEVLERLKSAHEFLVLLRSKRNDVDATIRELIDRSGVLDGVHDRKARGLHHFMRAFMEIADTPEDRKAFAELEALLFPKGLQVVRLPYIEEAGAAVALEQAVSPTVRAELAAIVVGDSNLAKILGEWLSAGKELGEVMTQRAALKASLTTEGSAISDVDVLAGRKAWIDTVDRMMVVIDLMKTLEELDEAVRGALTAALSDSASTKRRRLAGEPVFDAQGEALGEGEGEAAEGEGEAEDAEG